MLVSAHGNSPLMLRPLSAVLARLGVDSERFLADVGVGPDARLDAFVPNARVDRALESLAAARGDPAFGLTLAREAVARPPMGLFGHFMWLAPTVREALEQAARFYPLVTRRAMLALDVAGPRATLTQRTAPAAPRGSILTEYMFGMLVMRARTIAGDGFRVQSMRFAHAAGDVAPYEAILRAPVVFDRSPDGVDVLTIDRASLDLPVSTADPFTAAALEAQLVQLQSAPASALERIRAAVHAELREGRPSPASIARRLGVGGRTLRRQLEHEHVSLRSLIAAAQSAYASERLGAGVSVKELAFELGFSEPSAFSRAYKRWTGAAPSTRRAAP